MAILIFRLRNVPEDEAEDVRQLLDQHRIAHYETSAGRWGIGLPAIWINDDQEQAIARKLIDTYQVDRRQRMREEYAQKYSAGEIPSFTQRLIRYPIRVCIYLLVVMIVLYFSVKPFFTLLAV